MCLSEGELLYFMSLLDPKVIIPTTYGVLIGITDWMWVEEVRLWCIDGIWRDLPIVR